MFDFDAFSASLQLIDATPSVDSFELLEKLHSEPARYYHNKTHVNECLQHFQRYRHLAENPGEIEVAFWFHDAIYDTRKQDNEERSAQLAQEHLVQMRADTQAVANVAEMIIATKTHEVSDGDAALMVDIDLGILGTAPDVFERYDQNIRREFSWVPDDLYRPGRTRVLQSFAKRPVIFQTAAIREALESQARENLARKIAELNN